MPTQFPEMDKTSQASSSFTRLRWILFCYAGQWKGVSLIVALQTWARYISRFSSRAPAPMNGQNH
jgi:hypothetical protein